MDDNRPKVGVGLLIFKDGKLLLSKRKSPLAPRVWAGPGGHLENGETFEECAVRETREEAGIEITNVHVIGFGNLLCWVPSHYVGIQVVADWLSGDPQNLEPDKRDEWGWYALDALPQPLIEGDLECLEAMKTGNMYYGTIR